MFSNLFFLFPFSDSSKGSFDNSEIQQRRERLLSLRRGQMNEVEDKGNVVQSRIDFFQNPSNDFLRQNEMQER